MSSDINSSDQEDKRTYGIISEKGILNSVGENYFIHLILIILLVMLFLRKEETNTLGIAITACIVVIALGTENISKFSLGPKGIEFERIKRLALENSDFIQTFIFMSMQADIFRNLAKIASRNFGAFRADENFRQQLRYLLDNGFIDFAKSIDELPDEGPQLSDYIEPTENGIEFVSVREKMALARVRGNKKGLHVENV